MERHTIRLTPANAGKAHAGVESAVRKGGWTLELRPSKRSDEQNDALHGLIDQIIKQRPVHYGVKADKEVYKAIFLHAIGREARFIPTLDGDGMFPLGQRTSKLTVGECSQLIECILAWCAREGLTIEHFDDAARDREAAKNPSRRAA
jgi:hypothetical protein